LVINYSDFQSYKVHLSPLLAPPSIPPLRGEEKDKLLILEGVGGGVLVPGLMTICCKLIIKYLSLLRRLENDITRNNCRNLLELVERMLVYKSSTYSRQELKAMLGLTKWQKT
jgi:hypothetical protein